MPFTSAGFLFFFLPITIILYYIFNCFGNKKIINLLLILFSVSFYMVSGLRTTIYLIVFIIIIYLSGKIIEYINSKRIKREFFILSLLFIVLTLSYYKYITFILELFQVQKGLFNVIIPLGLSFIMFEAISYLVDIYKGDAKSGGLIDVFLFFTFFPKIASGTTTKLGMQISAETLS